MSSFPTGVSVVTTMDADGRPKGMTCSSLSSVSLEPPVLSVCLAVTSGTLSLLRAHGLFGVNLLGESGGPVARLFADSGQKQFDRVPWSPSSPGGVPRLGGDVVGFAACEVVDTKLVGDHVVIFGEVVGTEDGAGTPLLYGRRQFVAWPGGPEPEPAARPAARGGPAVSPVPPAG